MKRSVVRFDLENLGAEIWLVSNPADVQEAWEREPREGSSRLDEAAKVAKDCIVLAAHWGNDIPDERDEEWLAAILETANEPQEVRDLVESWWGR